MKLQFNVLGYTVASIELVLPTGEEVATVALESVVDKGVKRMSDWWVKRMMKR